MVRTIRTGEFVNFQDLDVEGVYQARKRVESSYDLLAGEVSK